MWKFSYLCNGINMKDILNLKWKNYVGDFIYFVREKTKRTKKETQQGVISVKDDAKVIIERHGNLNRDPEAYIFPFYTNSMSAEEKYKTCYNVKRMVNKNLKFINKTVKLPREPLFKTARYCFATALKRSKKSLELIQELLVHEDPRTTKNYVNSFENEVVKEETDILVPIQHKISDFKVDISCNRHYLI
jgi:integrase/recombinase XerD